MHRAPLRRTRHAVVIAAVVALTTTLSTAPAAAETRSGLHQQSRASVEVVPLSAELRTTKTTVGAEAEQQVTQETNHFYRDSMGRTRSEAGSSVTIEDRATQTTIVLDTNTRTFQRITREQARPAVRAASEATIARDQQLASEPRPLGDALIEGVLAEGRQYTVTTPGRAGLPGREYLVTQWLSADIQLAVQTRVESPGEVYEQTYTDINVGSEPAASLFEIPAGYQEADPAAAQPQAFCPVAWTSPVILTSFGPFLGTGVVTALTDQAAGCVFVADAAFFELPLDGLPLTALGQPIDEWLVFDTGLPVPFLPWTAFGAVGFIAESPTGERTIVESLVILDIF